MGQKLTAKEIDAIVEKTPMATFDMCTQCGGVEQGSVMRDTSNDDNIELICEDCYRRWIYQQINQLQGRLHNVLVGNKGKKQLRAVYLLMGALEKFQEDEMYIFSYWDWYIEVYTNMTNSDLTTIDVSVEYEGKTYHRIYDIKNDCCKISESDEYLYITDSDGSFHLLTITDEDNLIGDYFSDDNDNDPQPFATWDFHDEIDIDDKPIKTK